MDAVYSNAFADLAPTAAPDGSSGFHVDGLAADLSYPSINLPWTPTSTRPFLVSRSSTDVAHDTADHPPSGRAWVLQESLLSRRVAGFAIPRVHWPCREAAASESHLSGLDLSALCVAADLDLRRALSPAVTEARFGAGGAALQALRLGQGVVWRYSRCALTQPRAKLVVTRRLAVRFEELAWETLGRHLAGHWAKVLPENLLGGCRRR